MQEQKDNTDYRPVNFDVKHDSTKNEINNKKNDDENLESKKIVLQVNDLEKRVCYFSLAGDQALKAFEKYYIDENNKEEDYKELKAKVVQRLYFAVIMFDIVIFHCSDPLRSPLIKDILIEHIDWIVEGRIRFIASDDINDWEKDYNNYIDRKYNAYQKGFYARLEAESLRQPHITEEYKQSIKELLGKSKYYIRKDVTGSSQFTALLKEDIKHNNEHIVICLDCEEDNMFANVKQFAVEKTVYQLLHAQYYRGNVNSNLINVFSPDKVSSIFSQLRKALEKGQAVARPALVEAVKERINDLSELQEAFLDAITLRMDLLYCRMNAGKHLILEFHPSYEQQTIYKLDCFNLYLRKFGYRHSLDSLTINLVNKIVNSVEIDNFRRIFLASMADTHEQNNFTIKMWSINTVFGDRCKRLLPININADFINICNALKA